MEMVPVAVEAMGHVDVPPGIMSLGKDELAKILSDNGMDAASVTSIAGPEVTEIKSATGRDPSETATFNGFSSLVSVSFPAVTSIGDWAFMQYSVPSPLIDVDCPAATSIGQGAFAHSGSLTSIHVPAVVSIGDNAFVGCTSLESVDFPAVVSMGDNAGLYGLQQAHLCQAPGRGKHRSWRLPRLRRTRLRQHPGRGDYWLPCVLPLQLAAKPASGAPEAANGIRCLGLLLWSLPACGLPYLGHRLLSPLWSLRLHPDRGLSAPSHA